LNYACLPRPLIREILREIEIKYMIKKIKKLINNINKIIMNLIKVYSDRLGESRVDNLHKLQTGLCVISIILFIVFYSFFDVKFNNKAWFNYFLSFLIILFLNWIVGFVYISTIKYSHTVEEIDTIKEKIFFSFKFAVAQLSLILLFSIFFVFGFFILKINNP